MSAIFNKANTAVITGGASGIGLALARKCVGYGMRVLVADRDGAGLDAAKRSLGEEAATTVQMDVGKVEDWERVREVVGRVFEGQLNLLALNAGTSAPTSLVSDPGATDPDPDPDPATFQKILTTNVLGVVNGIAALLPLIQERASPANRSAVVVTGSKQGITNPPGNPAYNASKAAVRAVAEHLSWDLRDRADCVAVHLLVPGWTWTPLAGAGGGEKKKEKPDAAWTPEQVVGFLEARMEEGKFWVLCPDNDVTEEMDRKRMLWGAGDAVEGRPPLSRWREEFKGEFGAWMEREL